jgi:hypothetical protein
MWYLLWFAIGAGVLTYFFARPVTLHYPVPSIWQHPDAKPGNWDRTMVFYCHAGKHFRGAFYYGMDYVMDRGASLSVRQVNQAIFECLRMGYQQLDLQQYKHCYGLQNVA